MVYTRLSVKSDMEKGTVTTCDERWYIEVCGTSDQDLIDWEKVWEA